jgi:membrane-anchored glycerophosphoryl diester phosphodiesterase (GDPDase)
MYVSKCVLLAEYVEHVSGRDIVVSEGTFVFIKSRVEVSSGLSDVCLTT